MALAHASPEEEVEIEVEEEERDKREEMGVTVGPVSSAAGAAGRWTFMWPRLVGTMEGLLGAGWAAWVTVAEEENSGYDRGIQLVGVADNEPPTPGSGTLT
jgi:hypothetical protein